MGFTWGICKLQHKNSNRSNLHLKTRKCELKIEVLVLFHIYILFLLPQVLSTYDYVHISASKYFHKLGRSFNKKNVSEFVIFRLLHKKN